MTTRQLNIKNKSYYIYNDLVNILNFEASNLKVDKKSWKDVDIYYIGYVDKDKPSEWKINSVNPLYLIVNRVFCFVGEKNGAKYLKIDKGNVLNNWNQVFTGIKYDIGKLSSEEVVYESDYDKIKFATDDSLPFGKLIYFPTLTVVIRCVFKQNGVHYPQVYLDDCLYQI